MGLVLGGGAARGLAHIGALEVLERERIRVDVLVGSSMGGLVAALAAAGLRAAEIKELARGFRFPSWFIPGGLVGWDQIFRTAVPALAHARFDSLERWLAMVAVDLESGRRVVLHEGPVLPAVRATCAVPAVLPPEEIGGRWLVDGGLVSVLPVDVAAMADPDVVLAVEVGAPRGRRLPWLARSGWRLGRMLPNPLTAKSSFARIVACQRQRRRRLRRRLLVRDRLGHTRGTCSGRSCGDAEGRLSSGGAGRVRELRCMGRRVRSEPRALALPTGQRHDPCLWSASPMTCTPRLRARRDKLSSVSRQTELFRGVERDSGPRA